MLTKSIPTSVSVPLDLWEQTVKIVMTLSFLPLFLVCLILNQVYPASILLLTPQSFLKPYFGFSVSSFTLYFLQFIFYFHRY